MTADDNNLVLINVTGEDREGLTSLISGVLGAAGVDILDIGQAVIHNYLTLGFLARVPGSFESLEQELREQVAALAVSGAERILKSEIDASKHAGLLDSLKSELR